MKPTKLPAKNYDPLGREREYYELGRKYFSVRDDDSNPDIYNHYHLSTEDYTGSQTVTDSYDNSNSITATANYVQTPNYSGFSVSDGIYTGTPDHGIYAPKGSYVVSNNTILHLTKDTRIKGFRGWINLDNAIDSQSKEFTMEIFGMFDEEPEQGGTTSVPRIHLFTSDESVYDLYGRKMGKLGDTLPKGIYIVKGKKYMVK